MARNRTFSIDKEGDCWYLCAVLETGEKGRVHTTRGVALRVDLYHLPSEIPEDALRGRTTVVVDVLRASSSIAVALQSGCKGVIPTNDIEAASTLAQQLGRKSVLLCGERNGKKIDGFDLGNSPSEFTSEVVRDRTLVMATTNGSRAIVRTKTSALSLVGCFLNAESICRHVLGSRGDVAVVCAGKEGEFSLEDAVCGGLITSRLAQRVEESPAELNDAAMAARVLYERYADDIPGMLQSSSHGRYLMELGFGDDLRACAQIDTLQVVPAFVDGRIAEAKKG